MKYLTVLILLCNAIACYSQFYIEDKQVDLGSYDCLWISTKDSNIKDINEIRIKGAFRISNPYLFYPERFESSDNYQLTDQLLTKISDSVYTFDLELLFIEEDPFSDILFYICGYALAGSDSLCYIDFQDMTLNDLKIENFTGKIIIQTENNSIPYIRMPELELKQNPTIAENVELNAFIWQDSDVNFEVYDIIGNIGQIESYSNVKSGEHQFTITVGGLSSGVYFILMRTDHGTAMERILLIK